jgi:hypothetical protein
MNDNWFKVKEVFISPKIFIGFWNRKIYFFWMLLAKQLLCYVSRFVSSKANFYIIQGNFTLF